MNRFPLLMLLVLCTWLATGCKPQVSDAERAEEKRVREWVEDRQRAAVEKRRADAWEQTPRAIPQVTPRRWTPPTPPPTPAPGRTVTLREAVEKGELRVTPRGNDLNAVVLELELVGTEPLEVTIPAGLYLRSDSETYQNMIVTKAQTITVRAGSPAQARLAAACVNMHRSIPRKSQGFTLGWTHPTMANKMARLLALPEFQQAGSSLQQYAIWTLTDNPSSTGYVRIVRGPAVPLFGNPELSQETKEGIRQLFEKAGFALDNYRLFNPKVITPRPTPRVGSTSRRVITPAPMPLATPVVTPVPTPTPPPTPRPPIPRYMLGEAVPVRTRFGEVILPAKTEVVVVDFAGEIVRVKVRGELYDVRPESVVPLVR